MHLCLQFDVSLSLKDVTTLSKWLKDAINVTMSKWLKDAMNVSVPFNAFKLNSGDFTKGFGVQNEEKRRRQNAVSGGGEAGGGGGLIAVSG